MASSEESLYQENVDNQHTKIYTHRRNKSIMNSPGGSQNCFAMFLRSRVMKVFIMLGFSFMFTAVYINFFQHPPPDAILANNNRGGSHFGARSFGASNDAGREGVVSHRSKNNNGKGKKNILDDDDEEEDIADLDNRKDDKVAKRSEGSSGVKNAAYWEKLMQRNNFVAIGGVYDRCENWNTQIGAVILLPDKKLGGVMARTFLNISLDHEIDGGQFNIAVKYNGKDLYDNYWDICELEAELPPKNRTFTCPVAPGKYNKVKDRHIPNYLPKGRYETKTWMTNEDEKILACGFSAFTI